MNKLLATIDSYNRQANWHSAKFDGYDWSKYLLKFIKKLKGKKILDFGCGNGRDMEFLSKFELDLTGIDYSDEMVKKTKARVKKAKILQMDFFKKLKFKNYEFDGVWACASILHIPKKSLKKVLLELRRILKINGLLFVSVKEGSRERMVKDDYGNKKRFFSFFKKDELVGLFKNLGFRLLDSYRLSDDKLRVAFTKKKTKQDWITLYFEKIK